MTRISPSLETEIRPTVDAETAAHFLNYSSGTLRYWSYTGTGPLQPVRALASNKLQWLTAEPRVLIGGTI